MNWSHNKRIVEARTLPNSNSPDVAPGARRPSEPATKTNPALTDKISWKVCSSSGRWKKSRNVSK